MAGTGETVTYRAARRAIQPRRAAVPRAGPQGAATTSRSSSRTTRASSRSAGAPSARACVYTAISSRLTAGRGRVHRQATAGRRCSSPRRTWPRRRPSCAPLIPGVAAPLHDRRHDRRLPSLRGRGRARMPATPHRRRDRRATTCSIRPAPPAGPRASLPVRRAAADRCADNPLLPDHAQALRLDDGHDLPLAGAALPRRAAALQHGGHAARRHRR